MVEQAQPRRGLFLLAALTLLTMTAFAANSLLNRAALATQSIDPLAFTSLRLVSGALMLGLLATLHRRGASLWQAGSWASAAALVAYAVCFSLAYVTLPAGTGTLLLFASVQTTMIGWGLLTGERPRALRWLGIGTAVLGFFWLIAPGARAPEPIGAALMIIAGGAWGVYSLRGRRSGDPLLATAGNFTLALAVVPALLLLVDWTAPLRTEGVILAIASGAVASGLGYALWFQVLPYLQPSVAAVVQLLAPVIAMLAAVPLLQEALTVRSALAAVLLLGGVALAILGGSRQLPRA